MVVARWSQMSDNYAQFYTKQYHCTGFIQTEYKQDGLQKGVSGL